MDTHAFSADINQPLLFLSSILLSMSPSSKGSSTFWPRISALSFKKNQRAGRIANSPILWSHFRQLPTLTIGEFEFRGVILFRLAAEQLSIFLDFGQMVLTDARILAHDRSRGICEVERRRSAADFLRTYTGLSFPVDHTSRVRTPDRGTTPVALQGTIVCVLPFRTIAIHHQDQDHHHHHRLNSSSVA